MATSEDDVFEAANAVLDKTQGLVPAKVTIKLVREELGGTGSQPTLAKYLRRWKHAHRIDADMPEAVRAHGLNLLDTIWAQAKADAEREFHEAKRQFGIDFEEVTDLLEKSDADRVEVEKKLSSAVEANRVAHTESDRLIYENNKLIEQNARDVEAIDRKRSEKKDVEKRNMVLERENSAVAMKEVFLTEEIASLKESLRKLTATHAVEQTKGDYLKKEIVELNAKIESGERD